MEGTGCLTEVLICSPTTWARAGIASAITRPLAAIAQPFENALLDTFIRHLLVCKVVLVDRTLEFCRLIVCRLRIIPKALSIGAQSRRRRFSTWRRIPESGA